MPRNLFVSILLAFLGGQLDQLRGLNRLLSLIYLQVSLNRFGLIQLALLNRSATLCPGKLEQHLTRVGIIPLTDALA
jgi:hypothetical protein